MRVDGPHEPSQHKLHNVPDAAQQGRMASSLASGNAGATEATGQRHVSAPELAQLTEQLDSAQESREDLVKDAARRFANEEFGAREVAERTAAVIAESPFGGFIRGN
jgi:hypothetical protein